MATRFRLPASGTPPVSPAVQSYTHTGTGRINLPLTDSTTLASAVVSPDIVDHLIAGDTLIRQFVSDPLPAVTFSIGDAFKYAIQASEANASNELFVQIFIGIVSGDGTSALATLRSKIADDVEVSTTVTNRFFSGTLDGAYTCSGGERLVVEFSLQGTPVAAAGTQGHNGTLRFGSSGASGDLPENDTETGLTFNPWLEFGNTINFSVSTSSGAGRSKRKRKFTRLLVRINGEVHEVESVEQLMALLKEVKKEVKVVAEEKAKEIVKTGKRLGVVKHEEPKSIELVKAPDFAKQMIEERIREVEIVYWESVEREMNRLYEEAEEEELLLNG